MNAIAEFFRALAEAKGNAGRKALEGHTAALQYAAQRQQKRA